MRAVRRRFAGALLRWRDRARAGAHRLQRRGGGALRRAGQGWANAPVPQSADNAGRGAGGELPRAASCAAAHAHVAGGRVPVPRREARPSRREGAHASGGDDDVAWTEAPATPGCARVDASGRARDHAKTSACGPRQFPALLAWTPTQRTAIDVAPCVCVGLYIENAASFACAAGLSAPSLPRNEPRVAVLLQTVRSSLKLRA